MKCKIGDEVMVKCKIVDTCDNGGYKASNKENWKIFFEQARWISVSEKDIYPVSILQDATSEEVWEIAKKFNSLSADDLIEIFDTENIPYILDNLTFWNIKEKIEEWEQDKIEVGDVVEFEGRALLVTSIIGEYCCGIDMNGIVYSEKKKYTKKTVHHIDIDKILKEIGDTDAQRDN